MSGKMKRYFWLKLWRDYWHGAKFRYIRAQEGGEKYLCLWIDLLMLALDGTDPGVLRYSERLPYTPEVLAKITGVDLDTVRVALSLFQKAGMIEVCENGDILLPDMYTGLVGSESDSAHRVRRLRERRNQSEALHCNVSPLLCNVEERRGEKRRGRGRERKRSRYW